MKKLLLLTTFLFISLNCIAQYGYRDSNRIGISGGLTQLNLYSSQFNAKPEQGWIGGLSLRGNFYNNWQLVYGMQFTDSNFSLQSVVNDDINFKLSAVQIHLLASYMVVQNHLTLEIGPVLQINGKLKIDEKDKLLFLKDSPFLQAQDILKINQINGNVMAGFTAGFKNFRLNINYQYGFTNIMNNLNGDEALTIRNGNQRFKGNIGLLSGMLTIYL